MSKTQFDRTREHRIALEIVADANDAGERAMGWYNYLEDQLRFPFGATCVVRRAISPLHPRDEVDVIGLPSDEECGHEMFVTIRWETLGLAVPLSQLQPLAATDKQTKQAVADWHYWIGRGYEF